MVFDKSILSRSHKLTDADPTGTLDSCSGAQNKQIHAHNTAIEVETRKLATQVYRVPSHANLSNNFAIMFN